MRQMMFLIVAGAVRYQNSEWSKLYQRLVHRSQSLSQSGLSIYDQASGN
jgi:hypothetical protein